MTLPFYPFYWADYRAKTAGLTMAQHGAYIKLLEHYYCTGRRVPAKQCYSIALATLEQERSDVDVVLQLFFVLEGDHYYMPRAEEVAAEALEKHNNLSRAGKTPKKPRKDQSDNEATPKQRLSVSKAFSKQPKPEPIEERKKEPSVLSLERKRGSRVSEDFDPDQSCHNLAEALLLSNKESQEALENFKDYWKAVAGEKGVKLDWQATFRNQLRHIAKNRRNFNGRENGKHTIAGSLKIVQDALDAETARIGREQEELDRERLRDENGQDDLVALPGLREGHA